MKQKVIPTVREINDLDEIEEKSDARLPMIYHPQDWDIREELQGSEALRDFNLQNLEEEY